MTRKEYIEKLEAVRQQLLAIADEFTNARITDEQENEKTRRVTAGKLFDKLDDILYDNGAVSLRIMGENHERGIGEQVGLFDHANKPEAEVVAETTDAPTFEDGESGECPIPQEAFDEAYADLEKHSKKRGKKGAK